MGVRPLGEPAHGRGQYAALTNGVAAHSLEMDDTHQPSSLHPGATVFSTALATLEEIGPDRDSASRFVPAVAAGVSVHAPPRAGQEFHRKSRVDRQTSGAPVPAGRLSQPADRRRQPGQLHPICGGTRDSGGVAGQVGMQ